MSTDVTYYLVYGANVGYKQVSNDYEKYEDLMCGNKKEPIQIIFDGMNGKYAVAGKILWSAKEYEFNGIFKIDDKILPIGLKEDVCFRLYDLFHKTFEPQLMFIAHWH